MKTMPRTTTSSLAFVQAPEEMRFPYENSLKPLFETICWFNGLAALVKQPKPYDVIVIDLDCLGENITQAIESLCDAFAHSDLIALSSQDSAQLALKCLRAGFSDFLLKPTSPEELEWSVRRSQQHHKITDQLHDPEAEVLRAVTQISRCSTPALLRSRALEHLVSLTHAELAIWVKKDEAGQKAIAAYPKPKKKLPSSLLRFFPERSLILRLRESGTRKLFLPCADRRLGGILVSGIPDKVSPTVLSHARLLLQHCEVSLQNLQKLEEIKQQTFIDDLTGLYNSRYLKYALTRSVLKCRQPDQRFSVLFIDVDHFKAINDKNGHLVGSEFLIIIGKTVKNAVRRIDAVFRYGGDEFVVILQDTDLRGANEIAERIRKNIERRVFVIDGLRLQTTVSIGVATYPDHAEDKETLMRLADEAMYSAKRGSRNAVYLASSTIHNTAIGDKGIDKQP